MMASVIMQINELCIKVQHIPGGFTRLCQPVEVGVAKLLAFNIKLKSYP